MLLGEQGQFRRQSNENESRMQLKVLKSRLEALRRRRRWVRWVTAWSATALAFLLGLICLFLADWLLNMSNMQRIVGMAIVAGVTIWAWITYTKPWLGHQEDLVDVALLVEDRQHIDSDLVASLQFQEDSTGRAGSPQLQQAVIEYVDEFSPSLNVFDGFTYRRFKRRLAWLAAIAVVVGAAIAVFPDYARIFGQRLLLQTTRYPTDTNIRTIEINGVEYAFSDLRNQKLRVPYGKSLDFVVAADGVLPERGMVVLIGRESGSRVERELVIESDTPAETDGADAGSDNAPQPVVDPANTTVGVANADGNTPLKTNGTFRGNLPRLVDTVRCRFLLGDASTDALEIEVIPLPVVTVNLDPQPPAYAVAATEAPLSANTGMRQIAVLEGSSVDVTAACENKTLKKAWLTIPAEEGDKTFDLLSRTVTVEGKSVTQWTLPVDASPLQQITEPLRYAIQVEDADGLQMERPIEGFIRIRSDRPPTLRNVVLGTLRVMPSAKQTLQYAATDDYGLTQLSVRLQVTQKNGEVATHEQTLVDVPVADQPRKQLQGQYQLNLAPYKLVKGDEVRVTMSATDYRGDTAGRVSTSEALVMEVTDLQGILAALGEGDEKAAQELNTIIELGTGKQE